MKRYFTVLLTLFYATAWSQQDTMAKHSVYERHSLQAGISLGFIDAYRNNYSLPAGFAKNNTSGYTNISAKLDYGLTNEISLAVTFGYDAFIYNYNELYTGFNGPITRYKADHFRVLNVGMIAFYHLGKLITVDHLDPFVGAGIALNNLRHSEYPQGDSTVIQLSHTVTPYLKIGARYYISDKFSLFGDIGYDKESIFSLGFSCRFFTKKEVSK